MVEHKETIEQAKPKGITFTSNNEYFQLVIPSEYTFITNSSTTDNEMTIYDATNGIYIFGYVYQKRADFKAGVEVDYQNLVENDYSNLTENRSVTICGFKAYNFSFTYTNNSNGKDYYSEVYYIDGDDGLYLIYIDTLVED